MADHVTTFGFDDVVFGNNGNDVLTGELRAATLVGGNGSDIIRVGDNSGYVVAGGNLNGTVEAGETNTLEIRGDFTSSVRSSFDSITNVNAFHFIDTKPPAAPSVTAADLEVDLRSDQIGNGLVSLSLAVNGSATASPHSQNSIDISREFDPTDTHAVNLDLSNWSFTNWNEHRDFVSISTNQAVALNDSIVGTSVADFIETNSGDDTIRGGGGADFLQGDEGNDTFVYRLHEAARGEEVFGDGFSGDIGNDKALVLADNDFTGVQFFGVDQLVFGGAATNLRPELHERGAIRRRRYGGPERDRRDGRRRWPRQQTRLCLAERRQPALSDRPLQREIPVMDERNRQGHHHRHQIP